MMRYIARRGKSLAHCELIDSLGEPLILLALLVVGGSSSVAAPTSFSWNTLNGQFNDNANWVQTGPIDLDGVPDADDIVTFRRGSFVTYTVTFPGTGSGGGSPVGYVSDQLRMGNNNVTFTDANSILFPFSVVPSTYTVDNPTTAESGRGMIVGATSVDTMAVLTTRLAMLSAVAATIGDVAGSNGTLNVSAGTFHVTGSGGSNYEFIVGRNGAGALNISGGADVDVTQDATLGENASGTGTASVSGAGTTWTNGGYLLVGDLGAGTLNVFSGGHVSSASGTVGTPTGTSVTVTGSGSTWTNAGSLGVGSMLGITGGGQVSNADGYLGFFTGAGVVSVSEAGSTWTNSGFLIVGDTGAGTLNVSSGGHVSSAKGYIGNQLGSAGTVTVDGVGSTWNSGDMYVGFYGAGIDGTGTLTVANSGMVQAPNVYVGAVGEVHGNGFITGNVQNGGLVSPGNSPGALTITGNYTQTTAGKLLVELAGTTPGTQYDQLLITGSATLDGTLDVSLLGGFTPSAGDSFDVLTTTSGVTGTFANPQLPMLAGGLVWNLNYGPNDVILSVGGVLGDYNHNGFVDAADYVVWRKTLGQSGTGLAADGNNNGTIDPGDFDIWRAHFGQTAGSGSGAIANAAVPEPATLVLMLFAAVGWCLQRGRNT